MTIFRTGKPYIPPKPRGEPPASGFALWTWAASFTRAEILNNDVDRWRRQFRVAAVWAQHEAELDAREDEAWRMFGITVDYIMDERVVTYGTR